MRRIVAISVVCMLAWAGMARAGGIDLSSLVGGDRVYVERVLEVENVYLEPGWGETMIMFRLDPGDSIKISCNDCGRLLKDKNSGFIATLRATKDVSLQSSLLDRWLPNPDDDGTFGLVLGGDERRLPSAHLRRIEVMRKTRAPIGTGGGERRTLVEVINLSLPKVDLRHDSVGTVFYCKLYAGDAPDYLIGYEHEVEGCKPQLQVFKVGEAYARRVVSSPAELAQLWGDESSAKFGFQLAEVRKTAKKGRYSFVLTSQPEAAGQPSSGSK